MLSIHRKKKNLMQQLYPVNSVPEGFDFWYYKLFNYCLGIYRYNNLPESLPGREILANLIKTGHAVIFEYEGELVTTQTQIYQFDKYYRPTKATFGNPRIREKKLEFGINSEIVYLTRIQGNILSDQMVDSGLNTFICRYARMLADIEATIDIYIVNSRSTSFPVGATDQVRKSLEAFYNKIEMGDRAVITDDRILQAFRNVDLTRQASADRLNDFIIARDKILATFFREIGVKFAQEQKKAQLTEDEVTADEQLLLLNVRDMLEVQREGIERVNKHYGTKITVDINPVFDRENYQKKEVLTNGSNTDN